MTVGGQPDALAASTPGKNRYPLYRRLGEPQGRSGRAENLVPIGIRSRIVQQLVVYTNNKYSLRLILVITNLMHKILFYNKFIIRLYIFRALCAHYQEVKIVLYSIWYHHTYRWPSGAQVERGPVHGTATYTCDGTRCCIIKF